MERGLQTYKATRKKNVIQNIGLIYPSDYLYTFAYGVNETCFVDGFDCDRGNYYASWLYKGQTEWTQTPRSDRTDTVIFIHSTGFVGARPQDNEGFADDYTYEIRPCIYLRSDIEINGGTGKYNDMYTLKDIT